jgi:TrmH family RNA methyltransferase
LLLSLFNDQKYNFYMASKKDIQLLSSLKQKKYRKSTGLFLVEGEKTVTDYLHAGYKPEYLWPQKTYDAAPLSMAEVVSVKTLSRVSAFKSPPPVIAVFHIPQRGTIPESTKGFTLVLDGLQDPGNLGTIIRLADWFGVDHIICSSDTVDVYNPKVIQAAMGSTARLPVYYTDTLHYLSRCKRPVWMSVLNGSNLYETALPADAVIVMGNEAHGIRPSLLSLVKDRISIPGKVNRQAESLNVAMATAVILGEWSRQNS